MTWRAARARERARQERETTETVAYLARLRDLPPKPPERPPSDHPSPAGPDADDLIDLRSRQTPAAALSSRERAAWSDLDDELERVRGQARRHTATAPQAAPAPAPPASARPAPAPPTPARQAPATAGRAAAGPAAAEQRYAAWYRERQAVMMPLPADAGGVTAIRTHDTARVHDTTRVHDTRRSHDTTRRHGAAAVATPTSPPVARRTTTGGAAVVSTPLSPPARRTTPTSPPAATRPTTSPAAAARRTTTGPAAAAAATVARGTADDGARSLSAREARGSRRAVVALAVGLALVVGLGVVAAVALRHDAPGTAASPAPGRPVGRTSPQLAAALAWVGDHTADGTVVVVPDGAEVVATGVRTTGYGDASSVPRTGLLVLTPDPPAAVAALAGDPADSAPLAVFGAGAEAVRVLDLASAPTDLRARAEAGSELVSNPRITLDSASQRALRAGQVDPRLLVLLGGIAGRHEIAVTLPVDPDAAQAVRLVARLSSVDGASVSRSEPGSRQVAGWLRAQPAPFHADRVEVRDGSLEVEVRAPVEPGLLELGTFPTVNPDPSS